MAVIDLRRGSPTIDRMWQFMSLYALNKIKNNQAKDMFDARTKMADLLLKAQQTFQTSEREAGEKVRSKSEESKRRFGLQEKGYTEAEAQIPEITTPGGKGYMRPKIGFWQPEALKGTNKYMYGVRGTANAKMFEKPAEIDPDDPMLTIPIIHEGEMLGMAYAKRDINGKPVGDLKVLEPSRESIPTVTAGDKELAGHNQLRKLKRLPPHNLAQYKELIQLRKDRKGFLGKQMGFRAGENIADTFIKQGGPKEAIKEARKELDRIESRIRELEGGGGESTNAPKRREGETINEYLTRTQ